MEVAIELLAPIFNHQACLPKQQLRFVLIFQDEHRQIIFARSIFQQFSQCQRIAQKYAYHATLNHHQAKAVNLHRFCP
jgi:hypothetical protein